MRRGRSWIPCERNGESTYFGLLRKAGLMLYLSPSRGAEGAFLTGTGAGLSTSKPEDTMFGLNVILKNVLYTHAHIYIYIYIHTHRHKSFIMFKIAEIF